jgi:hypothetical protein
MILLANLCNRNGEEMVKKEEERKASLFQFIGTLPSAPKPANQEPLKNRIKV